MSAPADLQDSVLDEQLRALWRRRGLLFGTIAAGIAASAAIAVLLPPTYRSSATILIEQQEIPQELVRSTITSFADQRVQIISQRVMTTQNLLDIVGRYGLYPDIARTKPREAVIKRMREDVRMSMIGADVIDPRSGRPTRANIAFSVAYESRSPDLAFRVASELTSLYLNENLSSRARQAEQAAAFLADESRRLSSEIAKLEGELAAFKKRHAERLPELESLNLQVLDRTESEVREVESRIAALGQQRLLLEAQLAQISPTAAIFSASGERVLSAEDRLKALRSQVAILSARYAADHPDLLAARREIAGLEPQVQASADAHELQRQLTAARGELAAARERYAADHPDVRAAERLVAAVEQALAQSPPHAAVLRSRPDNPAYIQVKGQLDALVAERDALLATQGELRGKLAAYERRLAGAPDVEREYRALLRDYDNARAKYADVRAKQMEAQVSQNLEAEQKGERFTLIEPALPPQEPVSPRRGLILALGALLSVVLGIGLALLANLRAGAVAGPNDLRRLVEVPPLAEVPAIVTRDDRRFQRRRIAWSLGGSFAAVAVALVTAHLLIAPLDLLWLTLLRRMGV